MKELIKNVKKRLPWWFKLATKLGLARMPIPYGFWRRFDLFKHGEMQQSKHALKVFQEHFNRYQKSPNFQDRPFVVLEIGPGDSLFSGVIAKAFGAKKTYLIDVGDFAISDITPYQKLAASLEQIGKPLPVLQECNSLEDIMSACQIVYLTEGIDAYRKIPSAEVDFCFSNVVFEHIRKKDFPRFLSELNRVCHPLSFNSHTIDLRDHLSESLNSLRFAESVWESNFFFNAGFYTNRIRFGKMLKLFAAAGFDCDVVKVSHWDEMPIKKRRLGEAFRDIAEDELRINEFEVILTKNGSNSATRLVS